MKKSSNSPVLLSITRVQIQKLEYIAWDHSGFKAKKSTASNSSRSLPKHPNAPGLSEFHNSHYPPGPALLLFHYKAEGSLEELHPNKKYVCFSNSLKESLKNSVRKTKAIILMK